MTVASPLYGAHATAGPYGLGPYYGQPFTASVQHMPGLTSDQMQRLVQMLEPSPPGNDTLAGTSSSSRDWLIDSGASHHMTGHLSLFSTSRDIQPSPVGLPDGLQTLAVKSGAISLTARVTLRDVLYVPHLAVNLISISRLTTDAHCFVTFSPDMCVLQDRKSKSPIGLGRLVRGVFVFQ